MGVTETVKGLRDLADFMEQNPDIDWPSYITGRVGVVAHTAEQMASFAATPGGWAKNAYDVEGGGGQFTLARTFGPVELKVISQRNVVCEKKVVGVETVEIPDPDAPKVTVEREIVEWECKPILAREAPSLDSLIEGDDTSRAMAAYKARRDVA